MNASRQRADAPRLAVLYDGHCALCRATAVALARRDQGRRLELLDFQLPGVLARFPEVSPERASRSVQVVDRAAPSPSERVHEGVEGFFRLAHELPYWRRWVWLLRLPGIRPAAKRLYRWVAEHRYRWNRQACSSGTCATHAGKPR